MSFAPGVEPGRPNLDVFSETLMALACRDSNVLAVTSDSRGSGKLAPFAAALPGQIVEVGSPSRTSWASRPGSLRPAKPSLPCRRRHF